MKTPAAALFLALTVAVLSPVLAGHTQFFYRDVTRQYQPLQAQLDTAFAQREWPAWNASTQSGVPLLANLHAGALAPWAPLFRALDFHRAYALTVALAWALFMAGLYRFLRGHLGVTPSLLGGLAGGLSGVVLGRRATCPSSPAWRACRGSWWPCARKTASPAWPRWRCSPACSC